MLNEKTEEYILENMNLVRYMASRYFTKNIGIEYEDLVSYGTMGLIEAANSYKEDKNCKFSTYASLKIKAAIIDEIRRHSPISRRDVSKVNEYNCAVESLQNKLLREPKADEIAKYLNIQSEEVNKIENTINLMSTTSLDTVIFQGNNEVSIIDTIKEDDSLSPESIIEEKEKLEILTKAIDMLKEKDKLVLALYYYEELTLKELGYILEKSRDEFFLYEGSEELERAIKEKQYTRLNKKAESWSISNIQNKIRRLEEEELISEKQIEYLRKVFHLDKEMSEEKGIDFKG